MKYIEGGVYAAKGYTANGIHCGIRENKMKKICPLLSANVVPAPRQYIRQILSKVRRSLSRKSIFPMDMRRQSSATAETQIPVMQTGSKSQKK